jgi:hypothetical protein
VFILGIFKTEWAVSWSPNIILTAFIRIYQLDWRYGL